MISVSRKDWGDRSAVGLEMEEAELEEGEAFNYQKGNEDSPVDPDISSLSYIEEKLQSVLGHFQRDFEGGVSAENLGAKFGGYGSFLPTYQRSPEVVHKPQTSPKKECKPNALSVASSSLVKSNTASGKVASPGLVSKGGNKLQSGCADKLSIKSGRNEKPINNLKLRIKVGSENLLTKKSADIYNGLGLVSPSSSLDGRPSTSERQHHKIVDMPDESPTSILKIMTSFPVDAPLSPLSEDLIHLNRKHRGKHESQNTSRTSTSTEKSVGLINGFHSSRSNEKAPAAKRLESFTPELADWINSSEYKNSLPLRKEDETADDALLCEDIVSNALKLPLLSSSDYGSTYPGKDMPLATSAPAHSLRDGMSGETLSSSIAARDTGRVGNSGSSLGSSCNVSEYDKRKSSSTNAAGPAIVASQMAEVSHPLDHRDISSSKLKKTRNAAEPPDISKQLVFHGGGSVRAEDAKPSLELPPNGDNKKAKAAQYAGSQRACSRKDEATVGLSMAHKHERFAELRSADLKNDSHEPKKENEKPANRYKDFFGEDIDDDDEDDNESLSGELTCAGRLKDHHPSVKTSFHKDYSIPKERCTAKNSGNPQSNDKYARIGSYPPNPIINGSSTDAQTGLEPMVNEDWVHCDLCQRWRLLPLGTDPKSLPKTWTCSMMTWLPGMNRCRIPEEHTTNALRALYQPAPVVEAPISGGKQMGIAAGNPDQERPSIVVKTTSSNGKGKSVSAKATISNELDGSTRSSSSKLKTLITTAKGPNLSGGPSSPSTDAGRYQFSGRSSSGTEKFENSKRKMSAVSCLERGMHISVKSNQEVGMEGSKASKRLRSEDRHFDDEKLIGNNAGSSLKGCNASTSFSNNTSENECRKSRNRVSAVNKKNTVSDVQVEAYAPANANNASFHSGKHDEKDTVRKRKSKEHRDPETHSEKRVKASKPTRGSNVKSDWKSEGPNIQSSDYLKSDMGSLLPFVAANSSSSKVSGSDKNKTGGQEVKGSPIESVSSSPLRYHDADKVSSTVKNLVGKFDDEDSRYLTAASPRRLLGDRGSNGQAEVKKNEVHAFTSTMSGFNDHLGQNVQFSGAKNSSDQRKVDGNTNTGQSQDTGFHLKKSDHRQSYEEKLKSQRNKPNDTSKGEKPISRKETAGGTPNENVKAQGRKFLDDGQDASKGMDKRHDIDKLSQKGNFSEVHGNVKSHSLPPVARNSTETAANHEPVSRSQKDKGMIVSAADAFDCGNVQRVQSQKMKAENSNCPPAWLSTPNCHKARDADVSSPVRRESTSHSAISVLKEAKDLKHTADRMKNSGSLENISLYMEASLKFLYAASLGESAASEANKHNELKRSMDTYSETAKLLDFCAHEYEKSRNMAAAALAYKCVEVAYMRVVFLSNSIASRDRNELQSALQIAAPGESPSSSASDVDNLNQHNGASEKGALAKVGGSPHVSGSHIITSRNRATFTRLMDFAQYVNLAMEASRKLRLAFTAATSRFSETSNEVISSLRKALDYTFQDVEGFLRLIRLAMQALSS